MIPYTELATREALTVEISGAALEKTLSSFGALSAAGIVRRSFPGMIEPERRFDQHHDNDVDIPAGFREMMAG